MSELNTSQLSQLRTCPCCKLRTLKLPVKMKPLLLLNYIACLVTGQPFKKTYKLFLSHVNVTLIEVTDSKVYKMQQIANILDIESDPKKRALLNSIYELLTHKAALFMILINSNDDKSISYDILKVWNQAALITLKATDILELETAVELLTDLKKVSPISFLILRRVIVLHTQLLNIITESGFDSDFFTASLLDS